MIEHLIPGLLIQFLITVLLRNITAGATAACIWSVSREITQAEYRWIEQFGGGLRGNMPWWGGLDYRVWLNTDPWFDWLLPSLLAITIAIVAGKQRRSRA